MTPQPGASAAGSRRSGLPDQGADLAALRVAGARCSRLREQGADLAALPVAGARCSRLREQGGQIAVLLVGGLIAVAVGGLVLGALAHGLGTRDAAQRAADLAALAGARAMRESYARLFEPPVMAGRPNGRHLEKDEYLDVGRIAAARVAAANGAPGAHVTFPDAATIAPVRVRVAVERRLEIGGSGMRMRADAEAELAPPAGVGPAAFGTGGGYDGPLAYRQGKPTRCFSASVCPSGSRRRIGRRFSL